ncbi:MAG: condensation domain-containing protein, partial [Kitasatospora sp.]|nr:condensation domain-containing protein [Kitasatospora sp.]
TGVFSASPVQRRLWTIDRLPALRTAYLAPSVVEFTGPVDPAVLRDAFATVLARHPALRSRFHYDRGRREVCFTTDGAPGEVRAVDAAGWADDRVADLVAEVCTTPFDLATDAPARGAVITLGAERTLLVYGVHHIVSDGWSLGVVMAELAAVYRASLSGVTPALPAPVHPAALAGTSSPASVDAQLAALSGAPTDIVLPYDRPRAAVQDVAADTRELLLSADLTERLRETGAALGCTGFMTLTALVAAVLARRGGQQDFLFAFPWAGREGAGHENAVGMFVNTLIVRADLTGDPSWRELLARVRSSAMTSYRHADAPFDTLAARLHPDRDLSRPPLTPVFVDAPTDPAQPPALGPSVSGRFLEPPLSQGKYELEFVAEDRAGRLSLALSCSAALFDRSTAEALLDELAFAACDLTADLEASVIQPESPQDLTEEVAAAWRDVLGVTQVPYDVNFFDAGGDSLLLVVLLEQLAPLVAGRSIDAADLFEHSTVLAQSAFLSGRDGAAPGAGGTAPGPRTPDRAGLLQRSRRASAPGPGPEGVLRD